MSDVVLSASVRQNLLSLQSTADLLATTQNRLATGKKVNSALDNPTNYFTAAALDSRAGDINNLLDGIGNGVQVLQAANTGITSLQKLIDTAKSIANQALQTNVGYTKSNAVSIAIPGATASNLLATFGGSASTVAGLALNDNHTAAPVAVNVPGAPIAGTIIANYTDNSAQGTVVNSTNATPIATGAVLNGAAASTALDLSALATAGDKLTINGVDINFVDPGNTSAITGTAATGFNVNVGTGSTATIDNLLSTIDSITGGGPSAIVGGKLELHTGGNAGSDIDFTGSDATALSALGLTTVAAAGIDRTGGAQTPGSLVSATTKLAPAGGATSLTTPPADGSSIVINGQTISFSAATATTSPPTATGSTINIGTGTIADVLASINAIVGPGSASIDGTGALKINSGVTNDLTIADGTTPTGALAALGLTSAAGNHPRGVGAVVPAQITNASTLSGAASPTSAGLSSALSATDTITINGKTISFHTGDALTTGTAAAGNLSVGLDATVDDVLSAIDSYSGGSGSQVLNGRVTLVAGTGADLLVGDGQGGATLAKLGLSPGTTPKSTSATSGLTGLTLNIAATGDSTTPTNIVFGTGPNEVSTLDQLNAELMKNNLQASISTSGKITITTTNDAASSNIGAITGSATDPGNPFSGVAITNSTRNPDSQATRAGLVSQYNNIIDQIRTTAQDASFNGINLLNGDQLKLVFNETGTSQLNITGTALDPAGLGLGSLVGGTDFIDNSSTNKILSALNTASGMLRSQASTLGSNLSIVQIRQDFSKNLINVLQTGSANLTIADTNEEAANSQALATRQSIAVSALALANQSQQSVLKLLQ